MNTDMPLPQRLRPRPGEELPIRWTGRQRRAETLPAAEEFHLCYEDVEAMKEKNTSQPLQEKTYFVSECECSCVLVCLCLCVHACEKGCVCVCAVVLVVMMMVAKVTLP